jgi:hypothetical protein
MLRMMQMYSLIYKTESSSCELKLVNLQGVDQVAVVSKQRCDSYTLIADFHGKMVKISSEEANNIPEAEGFSIMIESHKQFMLFGPIRLVNHHCRSPNTEVRYKHFFNFSLQRPKKFGTYYL